MSIRNSDDHKPTKTGYGEYAPLKPNDDKYAGSDSSHGHNDDAYFVRLRYEIMISSLIQVLVSLTFWIWALINCFNEGFDLGVISFMLPLFAGLYGYSTTRYIINPRNKVLKNWAFYGKIHYWLTLFGHLFVSINYLLGALLSKDKEFVIYCIIFTILWLIIGILFTYWAYKWKEKFCQYLKAPDPLN